ncbi:hypothetical protein LIER_10476 [Lithospermum erythrorhizon]|uniref:Uncharacterized protein n=1 Tax=Lithospermum erythrorhizon TaxID=34254 RepID=A0AAV3PNR6_LITER
MLYSDKSGKVSPTRWHRYYFMVKDAFSDEVPHHVSMTYTTLEAKDSKVTMAEFQKLVDGFPRPLPLKIFCDPDVVIKVGLCKGPNNFPNMTLVPRGAPPSSYEKSDQLDSTATSKVFLHLTSDKEDAPQPSSSLPKVFNTSPQDPSPIQGIWYPCLPSKSGVPRTSHHSPDLSAGFMPIGSEEGYKSGHPYFVDTPYVLPSVVELSDDSVSRPI